MCILYPQYRGIKLLNLIIHAGHVQYGLVPESRGGSIESIDV